MAFPQFGAIMGCGVGLRVQSYAIPTMQGGVEIIEPYVTDFIAFAKAHPDYVFYDTLAASCRHFGCRLPNHQLQTVASACGYDLTRHHHALADAEACAHIAMKLL